VAFEPLTAFKTPLEQLGFVHRATNPELTKRYFPRAARAAAHPYPRAPGRQLSEQFALLFRDYLGRHPSADGLGAWCQRRLAVTTST
jgi:GrpB-like predicted nucleotidyltransferase (UPF0157 family)